MRHSPFKSQKELRYIARGRLLRPDSSRVRKPEKYEEPKRYYVERKGKPKWWWFDIVRKHTPRGLLQARARKMAYLAHHANLAEFKALYSNAARKIAKSLVNL